MKILSFLAALLLAFPNLHGSPQASAPQSSSSSQAVTLLTQSAAAMTGNVSLSDVTLSGTVQYIAGSDDESGTAVLKAIAVGASSVILSLPAGPRSEILNTSVASPVGTWSGPDGVSHSIAFHNLLTGPAWFFPVFAIAPSLSASGGYIATYIGPETHNGQAVQHVSVSQSSPPTASLGVVSLGHLSQLDFFLDATTLLPAAIDFNIHPDNNAGLDLPVEVQFSDYRATNGAQVAYHVQKYLNKTLLLDFQAQTVIFNTGLSASTFSAQ
jgi:hypothetical protein